MTTNFQEKASFIWQVADDILRGTFKSHEYGDITLPFVVLRRLDCVLGEETRKKVQDAYNDMKEKLDEDRLERVLMNVSDKGFYNTSDFDLVRLTEDANNIDLNFNAYLNGFSENVRKIIENFKLDPIIKKLSDNDLLFQMVDKMTEVDFHPNLVSNHEMGQIFEELLRRFSEMSNDTAGEHYTPREVVELMVELLLAEHHEDLQGKGLVRSVYDPACGTGGMLTVAKKKMLGINPDMSINLFGQELNDQTYAIAKSDFLITGETNGGIEGPSSSFSDDRFNGHRFNFMLSNPPYGVSWKKESKFIKNEANDPNGRFHAGTPRVSDGSLLFLQHMISKVENQGSRIAVIFNGSPLFTGDAGSGESEIRRWIIENDWLEAIIAMPDQMFFNTGISTYIWLVTNRKPEKRKGKVQLVDATKHFSKMRKSLGNKRNFITDTQKQEIIDLYTSFEESDEVKIFDNTDFGYTKVCVEQPQTDENGEAIINKKGEQKPDTKLRDYERIPLKEDIQEYFEREVLPHVPDAWIDESKEKIGYEINFTKYFYQYQPLRSLEEITRDLLELEKESEGLFHDIIEDVG
jgi:type I restriction enzyme M protein